MHTNPVIGIVGGVRRETLDGLTEEEFRQSIDTYRIACSELGASGVPDKL